MSEIRLKHRTKLPVNEIKKRTDGFVKEIFERFRIENAHTKWEENTLSFSFKTKGMRITGELVIENQLIKVRADLPLRACLFQNKIINGFNKTAQELFP